MIREEAVVRIRLCLLVTLIAVTLVWSQQANDASGPLNINPRHISPDRSVTRDYDIVYVRAPRKGDAVGTNWTEISNPVFMDASTDLMLLHPDGKEEVLVTGGVGSVTDPMVSFDGESVYYTLFHDLKGASISQG